MPPPRARKSNRSRKIVRAGQIAVSGSAAALLLAGTIACDFESRPSNAGSSLSAPDYRQWAETDGAAGRINMNDASVAFTEADSPSSFERRVNEIYEGDNYIPIKVEQSADAFTLEGWEDLDNSGQIEAEMDEKLFSIVRHEDDQRHEVQGYNANGYYQSSFSGATSGFLFGYMLASWSSPGYYAYRTSPDQARAGAAARDSYRTSPDYDKQLTRNAEYTKLQRTANNAGYTRASSSASPQRQSYQSFKQATGGFRQSASYTRSSTNIVRGHSVTGVRTGSSSMSRGSSISRGGGGFSGGGGAAQIRCR